MNDPKPRDHVPWASREPLPKPEPDDGVEFRFRLTGWMAVAWRRYAALVNRDRDLNGKRLTDSAIAAALIFAHLLRRETGLKDPIE